MRLILPNPVGGPVTIDTSVLSAGWNTVRHRLTPLAPSARRTQLRLLLLVGLVALVTFVHPAPPFPPSYSAEYRIERDLPQHDRTLPFPEGKNGRYIKFDVPQGTGFNHHLQRVLLQHHIAVLSNRSLAFEPVVKDETWLPFELTRWPWRSARIPLSAYVGNVINGFERFYNTPRAVSADFYASVCPRSKQHVITVRSAEYPDGDLELSLDGQSRITQLQVALLTSDKGCVRVKGEVFDDAYFDSQAPIDIVDKLIKSPVLQHFTFSPSVLAIVNSVMKAIAPESPLYNLDNYFRAHSTSAPRTSQWRHVLALHLRRGDEWVATCHEKGMRRAPFAGFNKLPLLPGNENVPPAEDMVEATRLGLYNAKCLPDVTAIIARARRMRKNHPLLRTIYILTDAPDEWIDEVRRWLVSDAWDNVFIGRTDVYDAWPDREVGVAVDMEVARRAGVFVGNGFSTTSSNVVLLRQRDGVHPDFTQFW